MQLVRFLMKLVAEYVQIELKDGTVVAGTIVNVAPNMNTTLRDVKMTMRDEDPVVMETINIRGSSIRHYILPDSIPLDRLIADDGRRPRTHAPPASGAKRGRGGGSSRGARGGRGRGAFRGRGRGPPPAAAHNSH